MAEPVTVSSVFSTGPEITVFSVLSTGPEIFFHSQHLGLLLSEWYFVDSIDLFLDASYNALFLLVSDLCMVLQMLVSC